MAVTVAVPETASSLSPTANGHRAASEDAPFGRSTPPDHRGTANTDSTASRSIEQTVNDRGV